MIGELISRGKFRCGTEFEFYKDTEDENLIHSIVRPVKAVEYIILNFTIDKKGNAHFDKSDIS